MDNSGVEYWLEVSEELQNTVILIETYEGRQIGYYNEGIWTSESNELSQLENNFLFSIDEKTVHRAVPEKLHLNTGEFGPRIGETDLIFLDELIAGGSVFSELGESYFCFEDEEEASCEGILGGSDEFSVFKFELWQLNTSGEPVVTVLDENQNGICDFMEEGLEQGGGCSGDFNGDGFINVADLGDLLSAFGSPCD